jgi:transposase-like protein
MPWKEYSVMEERLRFVARLLEGESMTDVCREFGVSRKTGYKVFDRYKEHGMEALTDRSRRPVRYANQLPGQIETRIVNLKSEKPHWGARKFRELLVRRLPSDIRIPAKNTIHCRVSLPRPRRARHQLRPNLYAPKKDQHLDRSCWPKARNQRGGRRHMARQLHEIRFRICRLGTKNVANHKQPVRREVVTYVLGTLCYRCVRAGHNDIPTGIRCIHVRPSLTPSVSGLASRHGTRRSQLSVLICLPQSVGSGKC